MLSSNGFHLNWTDLGRKLAIDEKREMVLLNRVDQPAILNCQYAVPMEISFQMIKFRFAEIWRGATVQTFATLHNKFRSQRRRCRNQGRWFQNLSHREMLIQSSGAQWAGNPMRPAIFFN